MLGTVGFLRLYPDFTVLDATYNAVQLLGFGGALTDSLPWELEIARLLGPLLTGYAAARGVLALSKEQLTLLMFSMFLRNHVVVAGLGDTGFALTLRMYESGARLVAIEKDPGRPNIEGCRTRGIPVLVGDAADPRLLAKARVGQARVLIAAAGEDGVNAGVAASAARLTPARRHGALTALVRVDDPTLHAALEGWALRERSDSTFRLETFNVTSTAAQLLMAQHPPFPADREPRCLIAGTGHLAEAVVLNAVREWRLAASAKGRATIVLAGPDATGTTERLRAEVPGLETDCRLEARDIGIESAPRDLAPELRRAASAYAAFEDEVANLAVAISLGSEAGPGSPPVIALVREEDSGVAAVLAADESPGSVIPFGVLTRTLTPSLVLAGRTEILAQAMHEGYRRTRQALGEDPRSNASLAPWAELPESLRESNRAFAGGIGAKLRASGCIAVPTVLAGPPSDDGWLTPEQLEDLAGQEHDRWCDDLARQGWRHGEVKDPAARTHPSLIPYDELSEDEREKDRAAIREIPAILGAAGFELRRVA